MSVVAAEHGMSMNDMLSRRRDSVLPRHTAALMMNRLLGLVPKQIAHEFGRPESFAHHALKSERRRLDSDRLARARFDELKRLCLAALAGVEESRSGANRQKEDAA